MASVVRGGGGRAFRVLCLHGMYQDARTFAAKTQHLCAACPELPVEYIYVDGPFTVVPPILTRKQSASSAASRPRSAKRTQASAKKRETEFRAWWRPLGIHQSDPSQLDRDRALLLSFLRDKLRELSEVDGVMGFSQGASLAAWMCSGQVVLRPSRALLVHVKWGDTVLTRVDSLQYVNDRENASSSGRPRPQC